MEYLVSATTGNHPDMVLRQGATNLSPASAGSLTNPLLGHRGQPSLALPGLSLSPPPPAQGAVKDVFQCEGPYTVSTEKNPPGHGTLYGMAPLLPPSTYLTGPPAFIRASTILIAIEHAIP